MLCLKRKVNEVISIGRDIDITVGEIRGNQVSLGIEAPPGVPIRRDDCKQQPIEFPQSVVEGILNYIQQAAGHIDGYFEPGINTAARINHLRDAQAILRKAVEEYGS